MTGLTKTRNVQHLKDSQCRFLSEFPIVNYSCNGLPVVDSILQHRHHKESSNCQGAQSTIRFHAGLFGIQKLAQLLGTLDESIVAIRI
mmetsp:Transcript_34488/g.83671  ORF Transcript_34488/g.83671 Transcript_34488/m.83671 type:complete len:88 (+) Transcript_34488:460-723(+)